jgi:cell division septum initiation protein DivIVA
LSIQVEADNDQLLQARALLESRLIALETERENLLSRIDILDREIKGVIKAVASVNNAKDVHGQKLTMNRSTRKPPRSHAGSAADLIRKAAISAVKAQQRPMTRSEILTALQARGVKVPSNDPAKFVGRVLWRAAEFVNVGTGYWLKGQMLP